MKKNIYIDNIGERFVVATYSDRLESFEIEKRQDEDMCGSIFKGRVVNVLPGMQAAFIDCGLKRNCYISTAEMLPKNIEKDVGTQNFGDLNLSIGDEVIVQVIKSAQGTKGAKVTTKLNFVGRSLIYFPQGNFVAVSHKITDVELKNNLKYTAESLRFEGEGIIVRTSAPSFTRGQLADELNYLRALAKSIMSANVPCGRNLYPAESLPIRTLRDLSANQIENIFIGSKGIGYTISKMLNLRSEKFPITIYDKPSDLFTDSGIWDDVKKLLSRRVDIDNGGYLIIDECEALTAIDVNTGGFVGKENLEATSYQMNIAAAEEIARQVKLRDIAGIVVVDFIDMAEKRHRDEIVITLRRALLRDKFCQVLDMSEIGLVEFTRARTGKNSLKKLMTTCVNCNRTGLVPSIDFTLIAIRAEIFALAQKGEKEIFVDASVDMIKELIRSKIKDDILERFECVVWLNTHKNFTNHSYYVTATKQNHNGSILL